MLQETSEKVEKKNGSSGRVGAVSPKGDPLPPAGGWYGSRHTQVLLCFLLIAVAYSMRVNLSVAIVAMTKPHTSPNPSIPVYDWTNTSVVLSSFFWGYILLQVFAGKTGELYGPRWLIVASMLINSLLCILTPLVASHFGSGGVMACRVIQGLFQGFVYPTAHNMLRKWAPPRERTRMATLVFSGSSLGTMIAMTITSQISASWAGWPCSFYFFGGVGVVFILVWILLQADSPETHTRISHEEKYYIRTSLGEVSKKQEKEMITPWKSILTSLPVWAIVVASFGENWGFSTLLTEMPTYIDEILNFKMEENGFLSAAPYFASWIFSYIYGPLSDFLINRNVFSRRNVRKLFNTIGSIIPAISLCVLGFVDDRNVSVALLILSVSANSAAVCGFQVNQIDLAPNHAGTLMGLTNGASNVFSIVAPLVVQAVVYDKKMKSLWRIIFIVASGIFVVTDIFYVIFASGEIQGWNEPDKKEEEAQEIDEIKIIHNVSSS